MIPYTEVDTFTDTDIYDVSDLVLGGTDGVSNTPIKALINRSRYLFNRLARFEDVAVKNGNYVYDIADFRKAFVFTLSNNSTFTLPDPALLTHGSIIPITTRYAAIKALTVQCSVGNIMDGLDTVTAMYMHDAERLWLMSATDHWEVLLAQGNFYSAGESVSGRKVMHNTTICNGNLFNRADMPRLAKFGLSLDTGIVDDGTWLSNPGGRPVYRGCFSTGNTTTTMRLPDERGMFERFLDLGRGEDISRLYDYAGGYEHDALKDHTHKDNIGTPGGVPGIPGTTNGSGGTEIGTDGITGSDGGSPETRGKNIGKLPLIKY